MKKRTLLVVGFVVVLVIGAYIIFAPGVLKAPTSSTPNSNSSSTSQASVLPAAISDLITVNEPLPGEKIASPLTISGKARGTWYFEASAPVELRDASGTVIGHGTIRAQGDWMTTEYVPFTVTLTFTAPATHTGTLVLKNDNPSGDPAKQKELDIPVEF